jgi:hypothetical protein
MKVRIYPPATVTVPPTTVTVPLATVTNDADPQDQQSAGQPGRAYPAQEQGYPERTLGLIALHNYPVVNCPTIFCINTLSFSSQ